MNTVEEIAKDLKTIPDLERNGVPGFVKYLQTSARSSKQSDEDSHWGQFSLESAMRPSLSRSYLHITISYRIIFHVDIHNNVCILQLSVSTLKKPIKRTIQMTLDDELVKV